MMLLQSDLADWLPALGAALGALGFREAMPFIFGRGRTECEKKLIRLVGNMKILITIMQGRFPDEPQIEQVLVDTMDLIDELEDRNPKRKR